MSATRLPRPGSRAVVQAVLVILGLLAMHGLTSVHHASAVLAAAQQPMAAFSEGHASPAHVATSQTGLGLPALSPAGRCGGACQGPPVALCITALTGAVLVGLVRRRARAVPGRLSAWARGVRHRAPPRATRDPVADLCVCRT